jgi:carboxymethylenebutenolidase
MLEDFIAAYDYLKSHKDCNGQWGFCFEVDCQYDGGKVPTLSAAVPYYGQPTAQEAEQITTPLLLHYAGLDSRVNEGWPAMKLYLERTI